jgi:hypothetical protein
MSSRHLEHSRTYPVSVEDAYDRVLPMPLTDIFDKRYLAIAPIAAVEGQDGVWGASVGQTRTIKLKDGGTMQESLTVIERPARFGYSMSNIKGPLKPLVSAANGMWSFAPDGTGTRITWAWDVTPRGVIGKIGMPIFAKLWNGYARQALAHLDELIAPKP